jgi:hypothetical protein
LARFYPRTVEVADRPHLRRTSLDEATTADRTDHLIGGELSSRL